MINRTIFSALFLVASSVTAHAAVDGRCASQLSSIDASVEAQVKEIRSDVASGDLSRSESKTAMVNLGLLYAQAEAFCAQVGSDSPEVRSLVQARIATLKQEAAKL